MAYVMGDYEVFMQKESLNNRIPWIDMAKGYGTLLVIYAHLDVGLTHTWIYTFHMPLFFFLSGYVFSTKYDFKEFFKRKCKSIVVPYFFLGVPMLLFQLLKYFIRGQLSMMNCFMLLKAFIMQRRFWTLWFVACLFCLNILFYILVIFCKSEYIILISSIIFAIIGVTYYRYGGQPMLWNLDVCFTAVPFFAVGYTYKIHAEQIERSLNRKSINIATFFVCCCANLVFGYLSLDHTGVGLEMFESKYGNPIYTFIAAFSGIMCVIIISKGLTIEPIRYIGENSMLYYTWHQTIMIPIFTVVMQVVGFERLNEYGVFGSFAYKLICMSGIIIALTICNFGFRKLGWQWMLGK